jgi:CpXC motif protein
VSTLYTGEFRCVDCGAAVAVRVADSLNANRLPEARQWVLDRTLFHAACPCGRTVTAIHPFLYVDFDRGLWIQVLPEDQRPAYHAREPEVRAAYHTAFDPARGPQFLASLGSLVTPRLVYGYEELREKIVAGDAGLDDALIEALKLEVLASHRELLQQGVVLLTLDRADASALRFGAYAFPPGHPGERVGDVTVPRTIYDAFAGRAAAVRDSYPALFEGVYVNVQRYRFEPEPAGARSPAMTS